MKDTESEVAECSLEFLVPDFETPCNSCGQEPTVTTQTKDGVQIMHYYMCGPCLWGEADTVDPDNW